MTITLTREEAQQVLDALEKISMGGHPDWANDVTPILRARLAQPEHEWQGLTDEEVGMLTVFDGLHHVEVPLLAKFTRAIEAKLKEKNGAVSI
jgi:hypothetical protein